MNRRILFIDDEASLRRTMFLGLNQAGYDVEPCENGLTALKKLDSYVKNNVHLDAAVIDIQLPDIDGIKLVKIIKHKYPGIPLIMITGYADRYHTEEIRGLNVNAFLEKPFTADELAETIVKVLEKEKGVEPVKSGLGESRNESAYFLVRLTEDADIFESYKVLYDLPNILYTDTTKGDYDIFILAQAPSLEKLEEMGENIKKMPFIKSMDYMKVEQPVLSENVASIISVAEEALQKEAPAGKTRAQAQRISSYLLMEVERERIEDIYPVLKLNEFVVYCDYTVGKYNLVLFVSANLFDQIDTFIHKTLVNMNGILKVKEYPIVNILQM